MNVRRIRRGELEVGAARVKDLDESSKSRNLLHSLERRALSSLIAGSIAISTFAVAKTAMASSAVPQQYQNYTQVIADPNTDVSNQLSNDVNNLLGNSNGLYADLGGETVVINSAGSKPITNVSNQDITQTEFNNWTSIIMNDIPVYFSAPYISSGGNIPASVQNQENTVSANANNIIGSAAASSYYEAEQKITEAIYGINLVSSSSTSTQSGSGSISPAPSTPPSTTNKSSSTGSGTNSSSGQEAQVSTSKDIASISLNTLPSSENVGTVVTFAGTVYGMDGKPFQNAPVEIVNTNNASGPETLASGSTGSSGTFSIQINMRNAGTYVIIAQTYNGTNNLNDINSGPSQIVVNPVFVATPKITVGADAQTSNDTNITINGSGFTPNGNVNIEWNNIAVLNTTANSNGNFSLQTTASQIVKASNGQLGSNVGINTNIDAIDTTSGKASTSIPIYLYTKSQSQPAQQTANPAPTQSSNTGDAGSQGSGNQSSGGSATQSNQSSAGTNQGSNASTVQTPTVYVMNADSSKFSGVIGSISNPYPGWNGWQGQGYYFFANKSLESANIISSTSDAQLYFIAMGGSEAQSPWPQISGLPQKVNYQLVQNKSQTALTGNDGSGSSQTNNGGSGNAAPPSSLGNAGSSSTSTTDTKSQGTYASGVSSGSQNSGSNGITVNIPGPGSGQVGGNSSYIPTTTIANPATGTVGTNGDPNNQQNNYGPYPSTTIITPSPSIVIPQKSDIANVKVTFSSPGLNLANALSLYGWGSETYPITFTINEYSASGSLISSSSIEKNITPLQAIGQQFILQQQFEQKAGIGNAALETATAAAASEGDIGVSVYSPTSSPTQRAWGVAQMGLQAGTSLILVNPVAVAPAIGIGLGTGEANSYLTTGQPLSFAGALEVAGGNAIAGSFIIGFAPEGTTGIDLAKYVSQKTVYNLFTGGVGGSAVTGISNTVSSLELGKPITLSDVVIWLGGGFANGAANGTEYGGITDGFGKIIASSVRDNVPAIYDFVSKSTTLKTLARRGWGVAIAGGFSMASGDNKQNIFLNSLFGGLLISGDSETGSTGSVEQISTETVDMGGTSYKVDLLPVNIKSSGSDANANNDGSQSAQTSATVIRSGTKSDPYQANPDGTLTWEGSGYYKLTANIPQTYGISPGIYSIESKSFVNDYNSWVKSSGS
ncbi:hypothetical protein M1394_03275 [Candidatus Marsarchaeota archaeon]|nr:hypothetical protein [Candidatus Marsarchaeota archaeon]